MLQNVNSKSIHFHFSLVWLCVPDVPSLLILIKCRYRRVHRECVCACASLSDSTFNFSKCTTVVAVQTQISGLHRQKKKHRRKIIHSPEWWQWWKWRFSFRSKSCSHSFCCVCVFAMAHNQKIVYHPNV